MQLATVSERAIGRPAALEALVEEFISDQDVAESSRATYRRQLRQFIAWLRETGRADAMAGLQREDILAFKDYLLSSGKASYTASGYLTAVRRLFEWLEAKKIYPNVARGVKGAKRAKGFRKDCLTPGQLREALESMDQGPAWKARDYALFNLLARTGLRTWVEGHSGRPPAGVRRAILWIRAGPGQQDDFVLLVDESLGLSSNTSQQRPLSDDAPLFSSCSDRNTASHSLPGYLRVSRKPSGE